MTSVDRCDRAIPACSVVVCTRDRPELLRVTLARLVANLSGSDELIVVDSASRPGSVDAVVETVAANGNVPVRVVRQNVPGASRARNAGLASARAPIVAFTDDDCLVDECWTRRVEKAFADPAVGFVTGQVRASREVKLPLSVVADNERRYFKGPGDPARYGTGGNMAFRRPALLGVGGFDEAIGPGTPIFSAEDQDALWRVVHAGWMGLYDPSVIVYHEQWIGRRQGLKRYFQYGVGAGAVATKAIRLRSSEGWQILSFRLWRDGILEILRSLRAGHEWGALGGVLRLPGVIVGVWRGVRLGLEGEHYIDRHRPLEDPLLTGTEG